MSNTKKHQLQIIDSDAYFSIDPITRVITNDESNKNTILQGDHNSERFTFRLPRYIDGHDMLTCNNVRIAYINAETSGRDKKHATGVYQVSDLALDPSNSNQAVCSWLISKNATVYTGVLNFMLIFSCMEDDIVLYRWKTISFESIYVADSLDSDLIFEAEYLDIIEQWKDAVKNEFSLYLEASAEQHYNKFKEVLREEMASEFDAMQDELDTAFKTKSDKLDEAIDGFDEILRTEITNMDGEIDTLKSRMNTFTSLPEGSTTGDAEVADIRVGADGTTYDSAGEAVRKQILKAKAEIDSIGKVTYEWIDGGYISSYGIVASHDNYMYTDYISLYNGDLFIPVYYDIMTIDATKIALYDSEKKLIETIGNGSDTLVEMKGVIKKDSGASYIRVSCYNRYPGVLTRGPIENLRYDIRDGSIDTNMISDGAITLDKLKNYRHIPSTNYINKNTLISGAYINAEGVVMKTSKLSVTDKIPLKEGTSYYWHGVFTGYYAFYRTDDTVIEAHGTDASLTNPFEAPAETAYGRFTIQDAYVEKSWIYTENEEPPVHARGIYNFNIIPDKEPSPTEYMGCDICAFTRGICIGDSLTAGTMNYYTKENGYSNFVGMDKYSYPRNLERMTGVTIKNLGHGGQTSAEWYETEKNSDLSGYDFAIIQLGVNDVYRYDGWTETSITGFTNIINKLKAENANIKIFVSTIIPAMSYSNDKFDAVSQGIRDLVVSLSNRDIILLDMALYGHTKDLEAYNCGHLSAYGYWRLAADYKAYIGWYMNKNPDLFREIQFIGTDYRFEAIN